MLETRPPGYESGSSPNQVGPRAFRALLGEARAGSRKGLPNVAEALSLWRGPALAEFTYEACAQDEIRRLRSFG